MFRLMSNHSSTVFPSKRQLISSSHEDTMIILSKQTSKNVVNILIPDTCTKTAFSFHTIYEQNDGVSMGSSPGPVMAIIL